MQAFAFGSERDGTVHVVVEFGIALGATLIQTDDPQISLFQLVKGARDVGDARDGKMLGCTGGGFDDGAGQTNGAALRNDDAIGTRSIGGANEGSEIVRIFDGVAHHY